MSYHLTLNIELPYNNRRSIIPSHSYEVAVLNFNVSICYNHPIHCYHYYFKLYLLSKVRGIKYFILPSFYSFSNALPFFRFKFLTYIIYLLHKENFKYFFLTDVLAYNCQKSFCFTKKVFLYFTFIFER